MSGAPLAPDCRHCGATNSSWASECWQCHQRDWREPPKVRSGPSRSTLAGCMTALRKVGGWAVVIALFWIPFIDLDVQSWVRIVGQTILILIAVVVALVIALFSLCMAFS